MRRTLAADLAPAGMLERALVERMAGLLWRLARTGRMECAMLAHEHAWTSPEKVEGF